MILKKNDYLRNILTIMSGTVGMQVVFFISLPIITKFFSPDVYGVYTENLSYALILSSILVFGLDRAIPLSNKSELDSNSIFLILLSLFVALVLFFVLFLFWDVEEYIYILFLSFGICLFNIVNVRLTVIDEYKREALSRFYQAILLSGMQLSSGFILANYTALIFSDILSKLFVAFYSTPSFLYFSYKRSLAFYLQKREFYTYGLVSILLTSASMNIPVLLVGFYYGSESVGTFFLAQKLTTAPVSLLGTSISKAYYIKINKIKKEKQDVKFFFLYNLKKTIGLSIAIAPILYAVSWFCPFLFSKEWINVSDFILILIPLIFGQMIYNPISMTLTALNKQRYDFVFSVFRIGGVFLIFMISYNLSMSVFTAVFIYSLWMMVLYLFMVLISYWCLYK